MGDIFFPSLPPFSLRQAYGGQVGHPLPLGGGEGWGEGAALRFRGQCAHKVRRILSPRERGRVRGNDASTVTECRLPNGLLTDLSSRMTMLLAHHFHHGGRARIFVALNWLGASAEVLGEKRLGAGIEVNAVLRTRESVSFVRVKHVSHPAAVFLDGCDHLF